MTFRRLKQYAPSRMMTVISERASPIIVLLYSWSVRYSVAKNTAESVVIVAAEWRSGHNERTRPSTFVSAMAQGRRECTNILTEDKLRDPSIDDSVTPEKSEGSAEDGQVTLRARSSLRPYARLAQGRTYGADLPVNMQPTRPMIPCICHQSSHW